MTCEEALVLISGHIDNENTPEEEAQLRLHLAQCDQCRQVLQTFLEIDSGIAALEAEPPAMLHERIMEAVRAEAPVKKWKHSFRWAGLAVAAALVVVIGMASMPQFQKKEETASLQTSQNLIQVITDLCSGMHSETCLNLETLHLQ